MSTDWIFWTTGVLLALMSIGLLWWALLSDRSGGRRRCPKCWYDMRATSGLQCPECGVKAKLERMLFQTRRRWRPAFIAAATMLASLGIAAQPKVQRNGWLSLVPTTILILGIPGVPAETEYEAVFARVNTWTPGNCFESWDLTLLSRWQRDLLAAKLLRQISSSSTPTLRNNALLWLEEISTVDNDRVIHFVQLCDDPDKEIRQVAFSAVASHVKYYGCREDFVMQAIERALHDEWLQFVALDSLEVADDHVIEHFRGTLTELLVHEDKDVREFAASVLDQPRIRAEYEEAPE